MMQIKPVNSMLYVEAIIAEPPKIVPVVGEIEVVEGLPKHDEILEFKVIAIDENEPKILAKVGDTVLTRHVCLQFINRGAIFALGKGRALVKWHDIAGVVKEEAVIS